MKKFYTLLAAVATTLAMNAATLTWSASDMPADYATNNYALDGTTVDLNANLSVSFANAEATENNYIRYRKVSALPEPVIAFYSKNTITFSATDATITSITFNILSDYADAGNDNTPGWKFSIDGTTLGADAGVNEWTGNASELVATGGSKTSIIGFTIEYTTDNGEDPGEGDGGDEPSNPGDYSSAGLFFTEDLVGQGEVAQNITLSENGTTVVFTSNSANAQVDASNGYFGTATEYTTLPYRYRPGGKSSNGINSTNKGVFTFPCEGTLYIYAYNNQSDARLLQLIQNDVTVFNHSYADTDYVTPEGKTTKIYPIESVEVAAGTATLLWPDNQVMLYGFEFVPSASSSVDAIVADFDENAPAFDIMGRPVTDDYKGLVIQNGKKFIRR